MMMIDVLRPLLCTRQAKWAEQPPKVMRRSERRNNLQICLRQDLNTGGSDLWSNTLPLDHGGAPQLCSNPNHQVSYNIITYSVQKHRVTKDSHISSMWGGATRTSFLHHEAILAIQYVHFIYIIILKSVLVKSEQLFAH